MNLPVIIPARSRPLLCVWETTLACNARCIHCGSSAGEAREGELTTDEALRLIRDLRALGCRVVTLSGGEPLLRPDWPVLASAVREAGMTVELITNGLLAADRAADIASAGFLSVSFSVDGPEEVHDEIRGVKGGLKALLEGAAALKARGVKVGAVTHINRLNAGLLEETHALVVRHGFRGWQVQLTLPNGRAARSKKDVCLEPSDLPALETTLAGLIRRKRIFIQAADTIGYMGRFEPLLRTGTPRANRVWGSCQAGLRVVGITSDGTVRGCLSMPPHFDEGNIRERSLAEIWNDPGAFDYNRSFAIQNLEGPCAGCSFNKVCRGGCTTLAWLSTGTTTQNPFCLRALSG